MTSYVYLDHAATTPVDPRVVEAMLPFFSETYGNPSSTHRYGRKAENAVNAARETIASILHCAPHEIVFTSCATESNNLALRGAVNRSQQAAEQRQAHRGRIITSRVEHHAVSVTAEQLAETADVTTTWLPVTHQGSVRPQDLADALKAREGQDAVTLVSLMYANNEIGTIQPVAELAVLAHAQGALFHTDAVQAAGQLMLDVRTLGVDMLSLSAHKFYGPKGVGLLYIRDGLTLLPSQSGGGQEDNRRAGTHNVPLIVGMAKALELAYQDLEARVAHYCQLRDRLIEGVLAAVPGAKQTGAIGNERLPNHASFVFEGVEANALLMHLDARGIGASSGSACKTGNPEPSEVLTAMGYSPAEALSGLRLTVGKESTDADVDRVLQVLPDAIQKLRLVQQAQA